MRGTGADCWAVPVRIEGRPRLQGAALSPNRAAGD